MAELRIEAPLAKTEDYFDFSELQSSEDFENYNKNTFSSPETVDNSFAENFKDTFSDSLEDLVNTFDDKITKCFYNYDEKVEKYAPVQVRTQEEIMNECQMWWTITGNYGNILPIDWSKSYARKIQLPALNLNEEKDTDFENELDLSEDEELAKDLDMHSLIYNSMCQEPIVTAEEVLEEIEEIMQQESPSTEGTFSDDYPEEPKESCKAAISSLISDGKLKTLTMSQLNEVLLELETLIKNHSETLVQQLALRDELEFEKELKNSFISFLLGIQNKRRQYHMDKKKGRTVGSNGMEPKYLTTVIPYNAEEGPPSNRSLQVLIKILQAINDDSPMVPILLTDYILKVLCPT
ncbi:fasciculation and elongation protein zeta-2-like [Tachypleus tridentatus]|uniref:fasciculation and elongation protein zeta-2-like n=1 Tax=Tachypleus tridentatus TaxID=6853 RepID=UPI003FD5A4D3